MSRPLRVLVAHQVDLERTGGMSRIMGLIHDRLARHGHQVDYFTAQDVPLKWRGGVGRRFAFPFLVRNTAVDAARRGRPYDIVNVHEPHALPITLARSAAGSPAVVVTSHGLERRAWELAKEEARLGRRTVALKSRITYPASSLWPGGVGLRRADHVFCLSAEDRERLTQQMGRRAETVTRIFPGADLIYRSARDYDGARRILFAAAWRDNKGIADLVPAFATLAGRHPSLTLAIVGAGVPDEDIRARFPVQVRQRLEFETPATESGMAASFAGADLFVLPSLFEGTPLTLMQSMMSGLPIVTTSTCGMKDVIADNVSGLLIPVRSPDAIVAAVDRLIGDRALRARLGAAAQADAFRNYTWDCVARPVEEAYHRLRGARPQ